MNCFSFLNDFYEVCSIDHILLDNAFIHSFISSYQLKELFSSFIHSFKNNDFPNIPISPREYIDYSKEEMYFK